jgi:alkylhydroperoxidase family enzyme
VIFQLLSVRTSSSERGQAQGDEHPRCLGHHPALARAFFSFNGHLLRATTLSVRQRELLILRVAAVRESPYEWAQHLVMGRDAGIDDAEIAWIAWGPSAPIWGPLDADILATLPTPGSSESAG